MAATSNIFGSSLQIPVCLRRHPIDDQNLSNNYIGCARALRFCPLFYFSLFLSADLEVHKSPYLVVVAAADGHDQTSSYVLLAESCQPLLGDYQN